MTSSNKKKTSDKCTVGGNDRDGTLCARKMKLESFINADVTVTTGRDDLPEEIRKLLPLLGTDSNNQLVTIPSILFKNAKFVSQCHVFGTKVLLYALTACCDQHQLNFSAWPNIFQ